MCETWVLNHKFGVGRDVFGADWRVCVCSSKSCFKSSSDRGGVYLYEFSFWFLFYQILHSFFRKVPNLFLVVMVFQLV